MWVAINKSETKVIAYKHRKAISDYKNKYQL